MLAHAGAADESLSLLLVFAGVWTGWVALARIRDRGFPSLPRPAAYAMAAGAVLVVLGGLVLPRRLLGPAPTPTPSLEVARPASTATLVFERPAEAQLVRGDDVEVVLDLSGARVVEAASTRLTPDTGHVHLRLDGRLVSMTFGVVQVVSLRGVDPGRHTLEAEFVAADHAPFDPRVIASVSFRTGEP